jgi:type I restriction enzyme R subunit
MSRFAESTVEAAALAWLESTGWQVAHGPDIAPPCLPAGRDMPAAERADYSEIVLAQRLRDALARLNPALSTEKPRCRANQISMHRSAKAQELAA